MNALLNTISAQITYTRGALIALFAGLFILAACGGGGAATEVAPDGGTGTNVCDNNIFDPACGVERQAERTAAINTCITAIRTGSADESCEVPTAVRNCLNEPFKTEGCATALASDRVSVTIETVQATRTTDCRGGNAGSASCESAIVNVCGEVSSTKDGVLFTETLCGDAYNARRSTLVNNCRTAGEASADACTSVVITTDTEANEKALDCVLDAFAEGCDTNDDVKNVVEKTDATVKSIEETKIDRVAFCRGADDFKTNSLCSTAIQTTCAADPFTQTTGDSPADFCTDASRDTFVARCTDSDDNNNAGCDTTLSVGVAIDTCVDTPYATGCGNAVFNGLKNARYTHCTTGSPTESCGGVEANVICVADAAKADNRANPFAEVCRNAGTYTQQQTEYCTTRTELPVCAPNLLTTCDANPFATICLAVDFYTADRAGHIADCIADAVTNKADCDVIVKDTTTVADCITDPFDETNGCDIDTGFGATRIARTSLCTPSATFFDGLCDTFAGIDTARDGICETQATSFHAGCLDRTEAGLALDARKAFVIACRLDAATEGCNTSITKDSPVTVGVCAANPYKDICKDDVNFADELSLRNDLCTDTALYFNPLCNVYEDIATIRETRCTMGATSFDTICDGKGYDEAREAGQEAFAVMCRGDSSLAICKNTKINASGSISVADCVNSVDGVDLAGDPWHPNCPPSLSFVLKERIERDRDCAVIEVLESSRCSLAKNFNRCVKDPFGTNEQSEDCDAGVYMANRSKRDTHCLGSEMVDDPLCVGRKAYICDGEEELGNPFATLCGTANHDKQIAFCVLNARTDGVCSNDRATVCSANPFNAAFGANQLDCTISEYYEYRRPACSGAKNTWSAVGASVDYCSVEEVAGVICGTDILTGTDAFADICKESTAMMAIANFNPVTEREQFCGDTRKAGARSTECGMIYTGLCTGANLVKNAVGMGGFNCLMDDDSVVVGLRENYCTTPASSFNPGCKDGTHGTVLATRKSLALTCRIPQSGDICDTRVNGSDDNGLTVAQCSSSLGDPYHADCRANAELIAAFVDERKERAAFCSASDTVLNNDFCKNARDYDRCIRNPYGKVTENGAECDPVTYADARANRVNHCRTVDATMDDENLCNNVVAIFCDGVDDLALGKDDPFALSCDTIDRDNSEAQSLWCETNGNDSRCDNNHAGVCSVRPFATNAVSRSGDDVNCLEDLSKGVTASTYAPQRLEFCATGRQGATDSNCDTTIIAPVVCANSEGENANPFADFCERATNDGQNAAALLVTRQATVARCALIANVDMPVCVKSKFAITTLDRTCRDGAKSVTAECNYEKYSTTQETYCTTPNSDTVFDPNCEETTHGGVLAARQKECKKMGSALFKGVESCTKIVRDICTANDIGALTPKGSGGHLCTDESGAYALARERACGTDGRGAAGNLPAACKDTVEGLCVEDKLIETEVGVGRLDCSTNDDTDVIIARQNYCAMTANAGKPNCAPTLTTLCTDEDGMSLVQTASNGYVCSASRIDTVLAERRRFCANPQGGNTMGCPVVLADLCMGASSLLNGVDTGDNATTHNCKDDMHELVVYQRQVHCADGDNDDMVGGCSAVLTTLCMEGDNSVQSQVTTTAGLVSYDCSTSTVPTVITARETLCQRRDNTDTLCTNTIKNFCGTDNENPHPTNDIFDLLCRVGYETARDKFCADTAEYQNTDCDLDGRKDGICDGEQVTDKPYAKICGPSDTNLANQKTFCGLNDNGNSGAEGCSTTISNTCDVMDGDPFDTLCGKTYHDDRATRCRQSELKTGSVDLPLGADCTATIALECAGGDNGGVMIDADPFDIFCNDTYDNDREAACRTGDTGSSKCEATIENFCEVEDVAVTAHLFDDLCLEGDTYDGQRDTFCTMDMIFDARCNGDAHGLTEDARRTKCLETGTAAGDTDGMVCQGFVNTACANPFTKQENGTGELDLCTGIKPETSNTYEELRSTACEGVISALPSGGATLCNTPELSDAICGNGIAIGDESRVAGSKPFAEICGAAAGIVNLDTRVASQRNACRDNYNADGSGCTTTIEDFCGMTTTPTEINNLFDTLCGKDMDYKTARDNACLQERASAGDGNDCNTRPGVQTACMDDPFIGGCTDVVGNAGFIIAHCTMGDADDIFDENCLESDTATYGEVDKARDAYCRNDAAPADGNVDGKCEFRKAGICGDSDTHNPFANLCSKDSMNITDRQEFCKLDTQKDQGQCVDNRALLCTARPFATNLGVGQTIDCTMDDGDNYDTERNTVANECRKAEAKRAAGTICTPDIDACNLNPFRMDVFNNTGCDADAFDGAFVLYCEAPATSFTNGCINSTHGAVDTARKTFIITCRDTDGGAAGCTSLFANGKSGGMTVAQCSLNPFNNADPLTSGDINDVCNTNPLFADERQARIALCEESTTSFNDLCKNLDAGNTDTSGFGGIATARNTYCRNSLDAAEGEGSGNCVTIKETFCDGEDAGDKPHAAVCGDNVQAKMTFCTRFSYDNNCTDNAAVEWKDTAVLDDGVTVLSADGVSTDNPATNYILGQINELNLGFDQSQVSSLANITGFVADKLSLSELDVAGDGRDSDSVAFATFINSDFADVAGTSSKQRFYAGLLSNTDLGDPLIADTTISTVWKAKAAIIVGTNDLVRDELFTLDVIFGDGANTITTRDGDAIEFGTDITFLITGKFNTEGVIFGSTEYTNSAGSPTTSIGSLTGLIGAKGAVGAFISGSTNDAGDFAGGFVADNPNTGTIDCEATGIPFNKIACPNAGVLRAELCRTRVALTPSGLPLDFDVMTDCVSDSDIVNVICASSGKSANPFDMVVCVSRDQTQNQLAFVDNCANTDMSVLNGATCSGDIMRCIADPFASGQGCGGDEYTNVEAKRIEFCAFDASPFDGKCVNVPNINVVRGKACAEGATDGNCGDENEPNSYIEAYCDDPISANDVANCGEAYELANPVNLTDDLVTTALQAKALNAKGTDLLTGVVVSGNASDDNDKAANFITAGTTTLDFGSEGVPSLRKGDLALNALANSDLATSGFAFAQGAFTNSGNKLYVGLLDSTNLGAPLSNGTKDGDWKTKLSVLTNTGSETADFTLVVDFATQSLAVKATAPTVGDLGIISIAGKFTLNGVIYGTVNFTTAGVATLTGLIGTNGAVGIFASDSTSNTTYVGGFVAAHIDCSETGTPFDVDCGLDTPEQLSLCGGMITDLRNAGGELGRCQSEALSGMICGMGLVPGDNPFAEICIKSEAVLSGFNVVVARQVACMEEDIASPSGDCMPVIDTLCIESPFNTTRIDCTVGETYQTQRDMRITTCKDYIMGETTPNSLCEQMGVTDITATCTLNPFASVCAPYEMQYASERSQRITDCRDVTEEAGLECSGTQDVICLEGGTPVSAACDTYDTVGQNIDDNREAFCRRSGTDSRCAPTRKRICDPLIGTDDILTDTLCTDMAGTYDIARGARCAKTANAGAAIALDPKCGSEEGVDTYLQAFCDKGDGGSSATHCPIKVARLTAWVNGARNFDDSEDLIILESVGADDTNDTNYVRAGASELDLGVFDSTTATIIDGVLMLSEAGTTDTPGSGVAFARINYDQFTSVSKVKHYAGILSGTDLGGPVATSEVDLVVEWDLVLSILIDGTLERATAKLSINLGDRAFQKITNKGVKNPTPAIVIGSGFDTTKFFITGGYTTEGIIYGTTGLGENKTNIVSDGTLTGLIGSKGAVAAFVSDGAGNENEYVGGFVADNPAITPDCSLATGAPFDPKTCPLSDRLMLCRDRAGTSVTTADCKTAEIRGVVCATTGNYASLVDKICDGGDYEALREQEFCTSPGGQANPFHPVCLAPMVADMYDGLRQALCDGQPVDVPDGVRIGLDAQCDDTIRKLCLAEPFNPTAGAGTVTFNCRAATDNNYVLAREAEIAFCADGMQSTDSRCMQSTVSMITNNCRLDPLDSICTPYPAQYRVKGEERVITCRKVATERGDVVCTHALPTICIASDTPFSDLCSGYLAQRKNAVDTCLGGVKDNLQPLPAICNVVVFNSKTVENCIADPFDTDCFADFNPRNCDNGPTTKKCQNPFYAASVRICETENTSFTAGCLVPANGFVPPEVRTRLTQSQTARRDLLQRCADTDRTDSTGCNTVIAGGKTLDNCIANPFDINCRGDAVAFALANSKDAVAIRTTLVARCADTSNTDRTNCETLLATGKNIRFCTLNSFDTDCFGGHVEAAFDIYRADDCTTAETSFKAGCTEDSYNVTEADEVIVKYTHTARAELALGCAVESTGTGCDSVLYDSVGYRGCSSNISAHKNNGDAISTECAPFVKHYELVVMCSTNRDNNVGNPDGIIAGCPEILNGSTNTLDVAFCSVNPFAPICVDRTEFLHARLEACKGDLLNPACDVEGALERTNYVAGDVAELRDSSGAVAGGIVKHTSTLNDVGYAEADDGVYDDQSASGFALVYIPDVRDSSRRVTSPSRYYAGLLSGTDVGGPLQDGFVTAKWAGKLTIISSQGELSATEDFTLDVNFDAKTIGASDTRTERVPMTTITMGTFINDLGMRDFGEVEETTYTDEIVELDYAITSLGLFYINGRFTDQGVIYGTTRLVNDGGKESSRGTLTGVIGQNGAVGAFVSSGSGNTFGEYAGGFVAAPDLNCATNPLDIRCNANQYYEARENACSGSKGWENPACTPVFERVCAMGENAVLSGARSDNSFANANLDCLTAPKIHEYRKLACDKKIGNEGGDFPEICTETVDKVCLDTLFDDLFICHRVAKYQEMQYTACTDGAVKDKIFISSTTSAVAEKCFNVISPDCNVDPFDSRFCYIGNNYNNARAEKCSDHNFAVTEPACTEDTTIVGATTGTVNVRKTYCDGLNGDPDVYNLCDNTADYELWRNAGTFTHNNDTPGNSADDFEVGIITGWNAATADDTGLIAGGESKLNLGGGATYIHNEITLTLRDSNTNGVAIASAMVGGQLQSYGGLLSGADVGTVRPIPDRSVAATWSAQIALLWQDGDNPYRTTILRNDAFALKITFAPSTTHVFADDILLMGADNAKFSLVGVQGTAGSKLVAGRITLQVDSNRQDGNFRGLVGSTRLLAAFASTDPKRTGANAFAGGLIAQEPLGDCVSDGTKNPITAFDNTCTNAQKRDEATRCYNERGNAVHTGDCLSITACFNSDDLFDKDVKVRLNNNDELFCRNHVFEGARAIYCRDNPTDSDCVELIDNGKMNLVRSDGEAPYSVCIGRPFGAGCSDELGPVAFAQSRLAIARDCMTDDKVTMEDTGDCQRFNAVVGNCDTNPFGSGCAGTFATQINAEFAVEAQISRLAHCNANPDENDLCPGALTHCAGASPFRECETLVTDYCLGGVGRTIGSPDVCVAELATTCEVNPFGGRQRCVDEQKYKNARLAFCEGDGSTLEDVTLAICTHVGLDVTICGDGTSVNVGTDPFADVCKSTSSNTNFGALPAAKEFYCGSKTIAFLDDSTECEPVVATACGTGGFNYSTNPAKAFDPLCRQDTYDYARLAVCTRNRSAEGCTDFLAAECPVGAVGNLIGCAPNENSTPISVWADNVPGVLAEGSISQLGGSSTIAKFAQAGLKNLDLSAFGPNLPQSKLILSGNSGVAFANKLETTGGGTQLFAGLLRGTNVGGPLVNNTANGEWTGRLIMAIGRGNTSDEVNFTLNVAFTGNGGTLTTQDTATADTLSDDIDLPTIPDTGSRNRFTGLNLRINGAFTAEGVIYGTTDLYFPNSNLKTYKALKVRGALFSGRLTGLVGKTGAVGAFVAASSKTGNISVYVGGFVASPDTADNPYEEGANCGIGGTPLDATICPEDGYIDATARAVACLAADRTSFTAGGHKDTVCKSDAVKRVICAGTDKYANPYNTDFCSAGYMTSDTITRTTIDAQDMEVTTEITVEITLAEYQRAFVNRCNANSASAPACSSVAFVTDCLDNPYSAGCSADPVFTDVRTGREAFCGRETSGAASECTTPVEFCATDNQPNCENIISAYCLGGANREINGSTTLCVAPITTACRDVNPFSPRCADTVTDVYDATRGEFCSSKSLDELAELGASLANDCKQHAQGDDGICGYYIRQVDRGGARKVPGGANRYDQPEVRVIGTNPLAAICTNAEANPDIVEQFPKGQGDYTKTTLGHSTHADEILRVYNELRCSDGFQQSTRVRTRADNCLAIVIAGATGYNAWKAELAAETIALIPAGEIAKDTANAPANFIAGHAGDLYLGVANRDVKNAETFKIGDTGNGFAHASTGTQIFTGLLSGTTLLGDALAPFMVDENTVTTAKWRSTLSFLIIRDGVITQPDPKEGFVLNVNFALGVNTITGIQNVGTGMVFQVAGEFTGNLLSGTVTLGEADETNINIFKSGGLQSTGILTGVIGVEGAVGVFKSGASNDFGDFAGGFVAAPAAPTTEAVWVRSFFGRGGNVPTDIAGEPGSAPHRVNLNPSSGIDITDTNVIADGASSFIRLNANNEIVVTGAETQVNPDTGESEYTSSSTINSLAFFNNNRLKTPDNGDSGVTFGLIARANGGVNLAGLWPTTNMGLPLTEQPTTAIWRGVLSAIYLGRYSGEKDARFTITFNGEDGGGTVTTTNEVFIAHENFASHYISIDAKFDYFGAISGSTSFATVKQSGGIDLNAPQHRQGNRFPGRVSGLIGEKGLIGAFVTPFGTERHYVGGFYALNPDAKEKEAVVVSGPTNRGVWTASFDPGGDNDDDTGDTRRSKYAVNAFGAGAPAGHARFALRGTAAYRAEEQRLFDVAVAAEMMPNPISTRALLAGFADSNVDDNGVGFGKVGNQYYSGLLAGANVGISLGPNQETETAATWSGKVAMYGRGTGPSNAIFKVSSEEKDISLKVTFDGTVSKIETTGTLPTFGGTVGVGANPTAVPYTLTIDATFNAAGVIKGTTNFYADGSSTANPVAGVVTGLIGTRGAIGSFISTRVFANDDAQVGTVGSYAGGFVVENPDYIVLKEIKPLVFGNDVGGFMAWASASRAQEAHLVNALTNGEDATYFIKGTASGITGVAGAGASTKTDSLSLTDIKGGDAGGVAYLAIYGDLYFSGLLNTEHTLGGALTSPPPTAVWSGKIGVVQNNQDLGQKDFYLHVTFDGPGGTVKSSDADGAATKIAFGNGTIGFSGNFTSAGVMTGNVTGTSVFAAGVLTGIIGEKGALGVFRSNAGGANGYAGGFTASNPDFGRVGATDDYKLWRLSFNSTGFNRQVSHPTIVDAKRANVLNPQGTNVNQFVTGTTHFVEGTATGLNLTGSSKVTGNAFTPTVLKVKDVTGGIAFWQGDVNVAGADNPNIQSYVGLLISTDVGEDPLAAGRTTYTGKIQAYVGNQLLSVPQDFTLNINYGANRVDAVAELLTTRFKFDGRFNFLGVMSGDVLTGADGAETIQGSFNGLLGTKSALGVFKNTFGNTGGTFIGGFAVVDPFVNSPDWVENFAEGGFITGQTLLNSARDDMTAGSHFIRATATGIRGTTVNETLLRLTGTGLDGGVAFVEESGAGYTGLLSTTNVGLPLENGNLDGTWSGKIQAYVGNTLSGEVPLDLTVNFGAKDIDGDVNLGGRQFKFDGDFNDKGIMFGNVLTGALAVDGIQGSFNGLIGAGGAVGAFKNNLNNSVGGTFVGGFVVNSPTQ